MPDTFNITPIVAPRVPLVDITTGLITREWFLFFLSVYNLTNGNTSIDDLLVGPNASTEYLGDIAESYNQSLLASMSTYVDSYYAQLQQEIQSQPPTNNEQLFELAKDIQSLAVQPSYLPQVPQKAYGAFHDETTQTITSTTTAYVISISNTDYSDHVFLNSSTQIKFQRSGTYNIQFSVQLVNADTSSEHDAAIWFRKNGTDIASSNSSITVPKKHSGVNGAMLATVNIFQAINVNDYIELAWWASDLNVSISTIAAATSPTRPLVPSVILTVNCVSEPIG